MIWFYCTPKFWLVDLNQYLFKGTIMELTNKKEKRPSKKILIGEIEMLDTKKRFNLLSLTRTNIDNLIIIRDMLKVS
tara:strand:- start:154 stop:384 length:231 start_codon:yes stop_codon:yes gene_type:complete